MRNSFKVISSDIIKTIIQENQERLYNIIRETYLAHDAGLTINPPSYFLRFPKNPTARIIALPAAIIEKNDSDSISGLKWISSYPENINKHKIPRASAVIILNDFETGYPIACLEGSLISGLRTAYSAVLAAEYIHKQSKKGSNIAFIGNGFIASTILETFQQQDWVFENIYLHDQDHTTSESFAESIKKTTNNLNPKITPQLKNAIQNANIIVFSTTSTTPYLNDPTLFKHNPTVLHISLRDLGPRILIESNNLVDDREHVLSANTSPDLTHKEYNTDGFINGTIAELISNKIELKTNKPTIFSPMGMGVLDIAVANFIYQHTGNHAITMIDNFFPI